MVHAPVTLKVLSKVQQISNFFHKTSTVRCPLPAHLIKSVHIEKNSQATKTAYGLARGQSIFWFVHMKSSSSENFKGLGHLEKSEDLLKYFTKMVSEPI